MNRLSEKHSITVNGHSTSITLEHDFWQSLKEIAAASGKQLNALIAEIDQTAPENLSGAIRVYVLNYYKKKSG